MDPGLRILTIILPLAMLLIAVVSLFGGTGRLARNGFIGIRMPSTMASDDALKAGHRAATLPAWCGFIAPAIVGIVSWTVVSSTVGVGICIVAIIASFVVTMIWSVIAASRAARSKVRS